MALGYYNRYNLFYINGEQTVVPYVAILVTSLQDYKSAVEAHFFYYGR